MMPVESEPLKQPELAGIDSVIPFQVLPLDIRGRSVQLGPLLDDILHRHQYPECVSVLLAEVITLTTLLGSSLKFDGKFIVQTQTDGPVSLLVVDFRAPQSLRAYARYDREQLKEAIASGETAPTSLLGNGVLAMTIEQGSHRYQGIVELDNSSLEEVARQYFKQSEQIPTEVRLAVAQTLTRSQDGKPRHGWQAGGVLIQFLPESTDRMRMHDLPGGEVPKDESPKEFREDDAWLEARSLMATIDDLELTDTAVAPETLLYRLFNEHGVRVFPSTLIRDDCSCSMDKVHTVLSNFSDEEIQESIIDGKIDVNCQFCSKTYQFEPNEYLSKK